MFSYEYETRTDCGLGWSVTLKYASSNDVGLHTILRCDAKKAFNWNRFISKVSDTEDISMYNLFVIDALLTGRFIETVESLFDKLYWLEI